MDNALVSDRSNDVCWRIEVLLVNKLLVGLYSVLDVKKSLNTPRQDVSEELDGLAELEEGLTIDRMNQWMKKLRSDRPVITYLPKFKMRSEFRLSGALKSMGMTSAFRDDADFSEMSKSEELLISEVIHQALVDVDEKGTEAAAATGLIMRTTAFQPTPVFRADHPFMFIIREKRSNAFLFMGRLNDPS